MAGKLRIDTSKKAEKLTPEEEILKTAKKRFQLATEAEIDIRKEGLDDLNFVIGNQWPEQVKRQREMDKRPCLTVNRLPLFVRQVVNEQRKNRPGIKISPVGDGADVEGAKIRQGLVRHIEVDSKADIAYDTAFSGAVKNGFGYFRLTTEYCDPMSFDQDIKIKRIRNPFTVYMDPSSQEPDGSDSNWGFITEVMTREDYKAEYPKSELASLDLWTSEGDGEVQWVTSDGIRVAEYYYKEYKNAELVLLDDGTTYVESEKVKMPKGRFEVGRRPTRIPTIKWVKMNAVEVLDSTDIPGSYIPIIPVLGEETEIDGKKVLEGIVRHAKDSQRMYNYWSSAQTETIALAPKAPFIAAEGQLEGHENAWKFSTVQNTPFLYYKPKALNGDTLPPPTRNSFEPPIQAITAAKQGSADDMKSTTGVYDAALGAQGNERSGKAILTRTNQTQTSSFHFMDNLSRALRHCGIIILEWAPTVYSGTRVMKIIREDGTPQQVTLNGSGEDSHDLSSGKYSVTVDTGPGYATKRQEAVESMLELIQVFPELPQKAGDLIIKEMDWEGAQAIAERLKPLDQNQIPPQVQQQMQQMKGVIDNLTHELNVANDKIHHKQATIESNERIAFAEMQNKLVIAAMNHDSADSRLAFTEQLKHEQQRLELTGVGVPVAPEASPQTAQQVQTSTGGATPGTPQEQGS